MEGVDHAVAAECLPVSQMVLPSLDEPQLLSLGAHSDEGRMTVKWVQEVVWSLAACDPHLRVVLSLVTCCSHLGVVFSLQPVVHIC